MASQSPAQILGQLDLNLKELKKALLDNIAELDPGVVELRVTLYFIATHASLEECAESLGLWLLDDILRSWTGNARCDGHVSLALLRLPKPKADEEQSTSAFDIVRKSLDDSAEQLRVAIRDKNHGVSEKYIRKIFVPLGVAIPRNAGLDDLNDLARRRGHGAHHGSRGVQRLPNPIDAVNKIKSCQKYMEELGDAVLFASPR